MKNSLRIPSWSLALLALVLLSADRAVGSQSQPANAPKVGCAFSNPAYSGWCRVTYSVPPDTTPKQVCEGVLSCLNGNACPSNPCNANDIRSGWRLEEVKPLPPPR